MDIRWTRINLVELNTVIVVLVIDQLVFFFFSFHLRSVERSTPRGAFLSLSLSIFIIKSVAARSHSDTNWAYELFVDNFLTNSNSALVPAISGTRLNISLFFLSLPCPSSCCLEQFEVTRSHSKIRGPKKGPGPIGPPDLIVLTSSCKYSSICVIYFHSVILSFAQLISISLVAAAVAAFSTAHVSAPVDQSS